MPILNMLCLPFVGVPILREIPLGLALRLLSFSPVISGLQSSRSRLTPPVSIFVFLEFWVYNFLGIHSSTSLFFVILPECSECVRLLLISAESIADAVSYDAIAIAAFA